MEEITSLISNVGFPIAAFILMWYTQTVTIKKLTNAIESLKVYMKGGSKK